MVYGDCMKQRLTLKFIQSMYIMYCNYNLCPMFPSSQFQDLFDNLYYKQSKNFNVICCNNSVQDMCDDIDISSSVFDEGRPNQRLVHKPWRVLPMERTKKTESYVKNISWQATIFLEYYYIQTCQHPDLFSNILRTAAASIHIIVPLIQHF